MLVSTGPSGRRPGSHLDCGLPGFSRFTVKRVWAVVEQQTDGTSRVLVAGNTNRNQNAFVEKLSGLINNIKRPSKEAK